MCLIFCHFASRLSFASFANHLNELRKSLSASESSTLAMRLNNKSIRVWGKIGSSLDSITQKWSLLIICSISSNCRAASSRNPSLSPEARFRKRAFISSVFVNDIFPLFRLRNVSCALFSGTSYHMT